MNFPWSMSYFKTAFWWQMNRMDNRQAKFSSPIHAWLTKGMFHIRP